MKWIKPNLSQCCILLLLLIGLAGCVPMNPRHAHQYSNPTPHWKEEVALADGGRIMVERSQSFGRGGYLGEGRVIGRRTLDFTLPKTGQKIHWEGDEHAIPMLLDFKDGVPYLAVTPFSCNSFKKLGSPLPPYALYKYTGRSAQASMRKPLEPPPKPKNGQYMSGEEMQAAMREPAYQSPGWERISMAEFPEAFSKANLVGYPYSIHEVLDDPAYRNAGYVTAELVNKFNARSSVGSRRVLRSGKKGAEMCVADQEGEMRYVIYHIPSEQWEAELRKYHPDPAEYAYYQGVLERLLKRHREMEWVLDNIKPEELEAYMNRTYKDWLDRGDHYRTLIHVQQTRQTKERK